VSDVGASGTGASRSNDRSAAPWGAHDVPVPSPHVYGVTVEGEAVLLDEVSDRLHHLNVSAALVWACLDGHTTVEALVREIGGELGKPHDVVLAGTLAVLADLDAQELLAERIPGTPSDVSADAPTGASEVVEAEPRWRRRPDALWRRSVDAVLVLPAGADEPVTLTGTGPALWELLAEPCTVAQLAAVLADAYDAPIETVEADIAPVVDELARVDALESA